MAPRRSPSLLTPPVPSHSLREVALQAEAFINATGAEGLALLRDGSRVRPLVLPIDLSRSIAALCLHIAVGDNIIALPASNELTTTQAAALLGLSRTRLVYLIERGDLQARLEGSHRRLKLQDVLEYQRTRSTTSVLALRGRPSSKRRRSSATPSVVPSWPCGLNGDLVIPRPRLGRP